MSITCITPAVLLAISTPALAEDVAEDVAETAQDPTRRNELSLELGSFGAHDPQWDHFTSRNQLGTQGIRGGYALNDTFSLIGSWHRGAWGSRLEWYPGDDSSTGATEMAIAFKAQQFALGPKAQVDLAPWLRPYATLQAMGMTGRMLLDDDVNDDKNSNELSNRGWTGGGVAALGFDFVPVKPSSGVGMGTYLEMGYGYLLPMQLTDSVAAASGNAIGDLRFNGFYLRWGVGIRF